jgi:alkanesulfonate monooxygenase SsuD/methylene tetrahydromethanopterin reductase-like flavin-dependent oxidoreductase (luciferase family)
MADRLKFGLYGLLRGDVNPGTLARRGRLAEQAGFESLWVGDHIALPGRDGEQPRLVAACCERPARLGDLEITITPPGRIDAAAARRYADLGVHRLVLQPGTEDGSDMEDLIESAGQTLVGRI